MRGSIFIAWRLFLRGRKNRQHGHPLFGAALGISLSLIPLVVVDHFAAAMIEGITARYVETSSYHFQIRSWERERKDNWEESAEDVAQKPGIKSAWVERTGYGLARAEGPRTALTLRAIPENAPFRDSGFDRYIEFDSGVWNTSGNSILLGREAARYLGADVGESILVLTGRQMPNNRIIPRVTEFVIRGVFSTGYQDLDRTWAFISPDMGWRILADENSKTFIGGKFIDIKQNPELWEKLELDLASRWSTSDWKELNRYLLSNLENTRSILLLIMTLIIITAVLNVMTSLVMLTFEHRREIGILKCTGTSPGTISRAFVITGTMAAFIGTIYGLGGGLLISWFINPIITGIEYILSLITGLFSDGPAPILLSEGHYLQTVPVEMRWMVTAGIGVITLILSIFASWVPAARAAKLKPLEVMRKH